MKKIFYFLIPGIVILLILFNMLYGHMIFDLFYHQEINKYSTYIHLQEEWTSYPANILYDITTVWSNPKSSKSVFYDTVQSDAFSDYNSNQLEFQNEKSFVRLTHEFSNCESNWKPPFYRYMIDTLRNKIELAQGTQLSTDPYISKFLNIVNQNYDLEKQEEIIRYGHAEFIPICTSKNFTSYEYSISINDKNFGFDVFFVPSQQELKNYMNGSNFEYYSNEGCFALNHQSFSGNCGNIGADSGLLVIIPDELKLSLTKVKISLHEVI